MDTQANKGPAEPQHLTVPGKTALASAAVPFRDLAGAMVLGGILALIPFILYHRAYFQDDMQAQYMPAFYAIGSALRDFQDWPFFTLQTLRGGNLLVEYQYAVLNPVALALYAALPSFGNLESGAAFLGVTYTAIMSGGAMLLARNLGISRPYAWVAVTAVAANTFIFYWFASSWWPGLSSTAFLLWAMGFIVSPAFSRASFLGAGTAAALTATAGWPQAVIVLAIFTLLAAGQRARRGDIPGAVAVLLSVGFGAAISLAALIPLLGLGAAAGRSAGFWNNGFLVPALNDVLSFSNPMHRGRMLDWGGYNRVIAPTYYAAWFVLPLAALIDWHKMDWRLPAMRLTAGFAFLLLVLTQGPEYLGPLRWPFRFLPYFHIALVMLALLLLSKAGIAALSRQRVQLALAVLGLSTLLSLQTDPGSAPLVLAVASIILAASFVLVRERVTERRAVLLASTSVALFVLVHLIVERNPQIPDWELPAQVSRAVDFLEAPASYDLVLSDNGFAGDAGRIDGIAFGQMGLVHGRSLINGYSPLEPRGLKKLFCFNTHGTVCSDAGPRIMTVEPSTGATYADLMRVGRIIVQRGPHLEKLQASIDAAWSISGGNVRTVVYSRTQPGRTLPGLLSWPTQGLAAEVAAPVRPSFEELHITSRDPGVNTLVFARLWWPGYRASFNGSEVSVRSLSGLLVAVDLPPDGSTGLLQLTYHPPGFRAAAAFSLAALLAFLVAAGNFGLWQGWLKKLRPRQ